MSTTYLATGIWTSGETSLNKTLITSYHPALTKFLKLFFLRQGQMDVFLNVRQKNVRVALALLLENIQEVAKQQKT